ncbi:ribonuclease D [Aestuariimicrobium sp. p3-SID1156]|uniref:ribonuclease D n=1 Tax=Aestuariimicrobium sp. p3-SID1156 TaxID=2916038 RepID=UPI00223AB494|nr:ribonuclease D [Aestuariimicrobium sp. p3-SID1156]MCT1458956.1 ribonuclease D [Aestuariimicrobium sp. p3-SID1156]
MCGSRVMRVEGDLPPDLAEAMLRAPRVGVDTETSGLDSRSDQLRLIQLYVPDLGVVLLRPGDGPPPKQLIRVLQSQDTTKVFHFAPFDLGFLAATWHVRARSVLCTKAAARLISPTSPPREWSLQYLLWQTLGIELSKGPVRVSDWGAKELSDEQVAYAAADVEHLLMLSDRQTLQLQSQGLWEDYLEICNFMPLEAVLRASGIPNLFAY